MTVADDLATLRWAVERLLYAEGIAAVKRVEAEIARLERKLAEGWDETVAKDKARAIQAEIKLEAAEAACEKAIRERRSLEQKEDDWHSAYERAEAEAARLRDGLRRIAHWPVDVMVAPASDLRCIKNEARALLAEDGSSVRPPASRRDRGQGVRLELQREILAAVNAKDEDALAKIAEREGIDPELWAYWRRSMQALDDLAARMPALVNDSALLDDGEGRA